MRLSADLISRFQKRHLDVFGEHISPEAAEADLLDLAEFLRITLHAKVGDEHEL